MWNPFKKTEDLCTETGLKSRFRNWFDNVQNDLLYGNVYCEAYSWDYGEKPVIRIMQGNYSYLYSIDLDEDYRIFVTRVNKDIRSYLCKVVSKKEKKMKLEIPKMLMEESVLVKFEGIENLHIAVPCSNTAYNWFFPLGGTLETEENLENLGAVEYVIKVGDRVRAWDYKGSNNVTGTYKGLASVGRDGKGVIGIMDIGYSFLVDNEAFINIELIKESKELIKAREALSKAKATVKANEVLIETLTS